MASSVLSVVLGTVASLVIALAALAVFANELRLRRKVSEEELDLHKKRFEREEREIDARQRWLAEQNVTLGEMVAPLTDRLAASLASDTRWAVHALERAKLGPYTETLFGERSGHFRDEKKHIAERFIPMLLRRCRTLIEDEHRQVYLLIDSGTTLHPFFEQLGEHTVRAFEMCEPWVREGRFTVVTNNLPGVQMLMEKGRPNAANRYSGLAVDCRLLPGVPLPVYSAVTGSETEKAITALRPANSGQPAIISLVTGNWIRIRRTQRRCPIPLARGTGHRNTKQAFIDVADEVYVVSPLGKVFANADKDAVNRWLGLDRVQEDPEKQPYEEVEIVEDVQAKKVALVSTSRVNNRVLSNVSVYLRGELGLDPFNPIDEGDFARRPLGEPAHFLFPFDNLPSDPILEREVEFPHRHTRRSEFIGFFTNP